MAEVKESNIDTSITKPSRSKHQHRNVRENFHMIQQSREKKNKMKQKNAMHQMYKRKLDIMPDYKNKRQKLNESHNNNNIMEQNTSKHHHQNVRENFQMIAKSSERENEIKQQNARYQMNKRKQNHLRNNVIFKDISDDEQYSTEQYPISKNKTATGQHHTEIKSINNEKSKHQKNHDQTMMNQNETNSEENFTQ